MVQETCGGCSSKRWLLDGRPSVEPVNEGGRRYYIMSGLLSAVVDEVLHAGTRAAT